MLEVTIPYTPREFAREIHTELESHRFAVLVAHRRFGKTVLSINHLIKRAFTDGKERGMYAYIAPFLNQAEQIAWGYLRHYTEALPNLEINQQKLRMKLPNGATIRLYGADNPDSLRGMYFDGVIIDEVAQIKPALWGEVIRPTLSDRKGWALFIGTPKGINLFSQMYDLALAKMREQSPEWWCGLYPVNRTKIIDDDELRSLQEGMSENEYRQEFLCDFNAAADNALIDIDLARSATTRTYREHEYSTAARVMGVDVARFGGDSSVIFKRQGLVALEPIILNKLDNMALADRVAREIEDWHPDAVFVDIGNGAGVVDYLHRIGQNCVIEVNFGGKASRDDYYANRRAEMWFAMRDWLRAGGAIPPSTLLQGDLCAPTYGYNPSGRRILEAKEKLKERIGRSPDTADALALTFAAPVRSQADRARMTSLSGLDDKPYNAFERLTALWR